MKREPRWVLPTFFVLVAAGLLLPFWPLQVAAVVLAGLFGRGVFAVILGLLLDVMWGAPTGIFEMVGFPLTVLALLSIGSRFFSNPYLF